MHRLPGSMFCTHCKCYWMEWALLKNSPMAERRSLYFSISNGVHAGEASSCAPHKKRIPLKCTYSIIMPESDGQENSLTSLVSSIIEGVVWRKASEAVSHLAQIHSECPLDDLVLLDLPLRRLQEGCSAPSFSPACPWDESFPENISCNQCVQRVTQHKLLINSIAHSKKRTIN